MAKRVVHYRNFRKKFVKKLETDISSGVPINVHEKLNPEFFEFDDNYWNVYVNGVLQVLGTNLDFTVDEELMVTLNFDVKLGDVIAISVVY
jgi:hypothetical protein